MKKEDKILEILQDQNFIDWVLRPDPESDRFWEKFISENPSFKNEFEDAIFLIKRLNQKEKEWDSEAVLNIRKEIYERANQKRPVIAPLYRWIAAASFLLVVGLGAWIYYQSTNVRDSGIDYYSLVEEGIDGNEIKIVFSDNTEKKFDLNEPSIKYNKEGEIEINSAKLQTEKIEKEKSSEEQLNQLIVPFGKRSDLTLSDGTRLWINSGSKVIYPTTFNKKSREIYVTGEAYLSVAHNPDRPFYVITDRLKIRVLGTEFNVSSYPTDSRTSVVLVNGSVQATTDSKKVIMKENQLLEVDTSGTTSLKEANVIEYISWKDGWMYCNNEKLETLAVRLSRYYNVKIRFTDAASKNMIFNGKLDLKSDCVKIFDLISHIAPIKYEENSDGIIISKIN